MTKFTLIAEHEGAHKITYEFNEDFLPDVLDNVELFLRGVGYVPNGVLQFVEEETYMTDPEYSDFGGGSTLEDYPEIKGQL